MRKVQVLGPGCPRCETLEENARAAVARSGIECEVEKVTDLNRIAACGVMLTPGLVVDGEIKAVGKVLSPEEIEALL